MANFYLAKQQNPKIENLLYNFLKNPKVAVAQNK